MSYLTKERGKGHQGQRAITVKPALVDLANKYHVGDLPGTFIPGSRIVKILEQLESGQSLSSYTLEYLHKKGFLALFQYGQKELSFPDFQKAAETEQAARYAVAEEKQLKEQAEQKLREAERKLKEKAMFDKIRREKERAAAKKRAFDNDPKNIAKAKQLKLRRRYDLSDFIEKNYFPRLMHVLRQVDNGLRLSEEDVVWLTTKGKEYYTRELREGYHRNEAEFYAGEFKKKRDPWSAVNASSHYRKCGRAKIADSMLATIIVTKLKNSRLKSALCTTHGGVKRDLREYEDALSLGEQAHMLTPKDFRPCTLLGAVNIEIGHYDLGQGWYKKAVERGASEKSVDDDLRSIFMRAEKTKQEELRDYLLKFDPVRYRWAKKKPGKSQRNRR